MPYIDIESRFGDVMLRVTPVRHPWDSATAAWDMQVTGQDFDASAVVIEDDEAPQSLVEFCRELADEHKGWDGDKHWQSAGGEMTIRADHDQINTTRLHVSLTGGPTPRWTACAELHVDPGRFDRVARNLQLFGAQVVSGDLDADAEPERIDPRQRAREPRKKIGTPNIKQVGY